MFIWLFLSIIISCGYHWNPSVILMVLPASPWCSLEMHLGCWSRWNEKSATRPLARHWSDTCDYRVHHGTGWADRGCRYCQSSVWMRAEQGQVWWVSGCLRANAWMSGWQTCGVHSLLAPVLSVNMEKMTPHPLHNRSLLWRKDNAWCEDFVLFFSHRLA
jgi:hypothetical protein